MAAGTNSADGLTMRPIAHTRTSRCFSSRALDNDHLRPSGSAAAAAATIQRPFHFQQIFWTRLCVYHIGRQQLSTCTASRKRRIPGRRTLQAVDFVPVKAANLEQTEGAGGGVKKKGIGDGTLTSMLTSLFAVQSGTRRRRDERREETNGILGGVGWRRVGDGGGGDRAVSCRFAATVYRFSTLSCNASSLCLEDGRRLNCLTGCQRASVGGNSQPLLFLLSRNSRRHRWRHRTLSDPRQPFLSSFFFGRCSTAFYCSLSWPDTSMQSEWNALTGWAADKMNTPKGGGSSRAHFLFLVIDVDEVETGSWSASSCLFRRPRKEAKLSNQQQQQQHWMQSMPQLVIYKHRSGVETASCGPECGRMVTFSRAQIEGALCVF